MFKGVLCLFVVFLAHQGLAHQSITAYLSGVRNLAIVNGNILVDKDQMPRLQLVLRGVARSPSPQGGTRPRLPITSAIMRGYGLGTTLSLG